MKSSVALILLVARANAFLPALLGPNALLRQSSLNQQNAGDYPPFDDSDTNRFIPSEDTPQEISADEQLSSEDLGAQISVDDETEDFVNTIPWETQEFDESAPIEENQEIDDQVIIQEFIEENSVPEEVAEPTEDTPQAEIAESIPTGDYSAEENIDFSDESVEFPYGEEPVVDYDPVDEVVAELPEDAEEEFLQPEEVDQELSYIQEPEVEVAEPVLVGNFLGSDELEMDEESEPNLEVTEPAMEDADYSDEESELTELEAEIQDVVDEPEETSRDTADSVQLEVEIDEEDEEPDFEAAEPVMEDADFAEGPNDVPEPQGEIEDADEQPELNADAAEVEDVLDESSQELTDSAQLEVEFEDADEEPEPTAVLSVPIMDDDGSSGDDVGDSPQDASDTMEAQEDGQEIELASEAEETEGRPTFFAEPVTKSVAVESIETSETQEVVSGDASLPADDMPAPVPDENSEPLPFMVDVQNPTPDVRKRLEKLRDNQVLQSFMKVSTEVASGENELVSTLWQVSNQVATDLFGVVRRKAARSLTESLPEEERLALLKRTTETDTSSEDSSSSESPSISSMTVQESQVAAAVKEAQREGAWEEEKARIYEEAERAATERLQTELTIQKERMEREQDNIMGEAQALREELDREKQALVDMQQAAQQEREALLSEQADSLEEEQRAKLAALELELREKEEQALLDQQVLKEYEERLEAATRELEAQGESTEQQQEGEHPILGPVIQDLGHKRIHLVSVQKLATIPIWERQRIYRNDRTKAMVKDKLKSMRLGLPGIICLHEDTEGKLSIIDGQHRVGMMMLLAEKQSDEIDFDNILVEVYPQFDVDDTSHAQDLFLEINKAEPVKLVDMPGVATAKDRDVITGAVELLYDLYPEMFSPSQKCRPPNVNTDNLRDRLFGAQVLKIHKLRSAKTLLEWMLDQNAVLATKYGDESVARENVSPKALQKAREKGFYLGLESTWFYQ